MTVETTIETNTRWLHQAIEDINKFEHERLASFADGLMILRTEGKMVEQYNEKDRSEASRVNCGWLSTYIGSIVRNYVHGYREAVQADTHTEGGVPFSFTEYSIEALSELPESFLNDLNVLSTDASTKSPPDSWMFKFAMFVNNNKVQTGVKPEDLGFELWPSKSQNTVISQLRLTSTILRNKVSDFIL